MQLIDTHFHLDLSKNYAEIIEETERLKIYTIAVTTIPSAFEKSTALTQGCKFIQTALGFHPELVTSRQLEIGQFEKLVENTRYIGEVGLDFVKRSDDEIKIQEKVFTKILSLCANKNKILSIHSRQAADKTIEIIGKSYPGTIIMHWFSGSLSTLSNAIENGYYFSINYAMTNSDKGKRIVKGIPLDKILLESDGPFISINNLPTQPKDTIHALNGIADILGIKVETLSQKIFKNFQVILSH